MDYVVALFVDGDVVAVVVVNVVVGVASDVPVADLFCCGNPWWQLLSFLWWVGWERRFVFVSNPTKADVRVTFGFSYGCDNK